MYLSLLLPKKAAKIALEEEISARGYSLLSIKLINIGFGNIVSANRIVSIVSPDSAPIKRIIQEARERGVLIDATYGRRTRAVIITDSDHVILSAVQPETVAHRLANREQSSSQLNRKDLLMKAHYQNIGSINCDFRTFRCWKGNGMCTFAKKDATIGLFSFGNNPKAPQR